MSSKVADIPEELSKLDDFLANRESAYNLKPGTEAKIVWHGEAVHQQTDYAIVYLHGFRASHPEGYPVHQQIANHFGFNLFLSRMEEHGVVSDYPLLNLTEEKLLRSARFAFEIGCRIGRNVILMGTSTGGSLGLYLAAQREYQEKISALVLYSPLIGFYGIKEKLLKYPLARGCLKTILGIKHLVESKQSYAEERIWNSSYALKGALALGEFVQHHMHKDLFNNVTCPVFTGYYYKNNREQDQVVSVPAIKVMIKELATRTRFVDEMNFPGAKNHVICNSLLSEAINEVTDETKIFLKSVVSQETSES